MLDKNTNPERRNKGTADYYDMTETSVKYSEGTLQFHQSESDDLKEEPVQRPIRSPSGYNWGQNKVSTSIDNE